MNTVTVYTKPGCVQCTATFKALDKNGVAYEKVDVTQNVDAYDYVMSLGYLQVPVVISPAGHFGGFRPDRIKALKNGAILSSDATAVTA
jgi:glutaredoxin-like protein NrdH